jgi:hypothetical protein
LGQLRFSHFDARKNGKSNVNKIEMKNELLVGSNIFFINTNMHKNKVQIPPALSVKELETKLVLVRPK